MLRNFPIGSERGFADSKNVVVPALLIERDTVSRDEVLPDGAGSEKATINRSKPVSNEGKMYSRICGLVE